MKQLLILILLQFCIISAFSQKHDSVPMTKGIRDTTYLGKYAIRLFDSFDLADISKTKASFFFRFQNHGQVVDLWKNPSDSIFGTITNYVFHQRRKNHDTLYLKESISNKTAIYAYDLVFADSLLSLPSDNEIDGWQQGFDGITYFIETYHNNNYSFKTYWTPTAQDSLPEALLVEKFVNAFSDTLGLKQSRNCFMNSLPHNGCYNSGGMTVMCYIESSLGVGYNATIKMPYGYFLSFYKSFIRNTSVDLYGIFKHKFDINGNYDYSIGFGKGSVFLKDSDNHDNSIYLNYRGRKIKSLNPNLVYRNYQLNYWEIFPDIISFTIGVDYFDNSMENKFGGLLGLSKYFKKPKLTLDGQTIVYSDNIDYSIYLTRTFFNRGHSSIESINIGLHYENFLTYRDFGCSISMYF